MGGTFQVCYRRTRREKGGHLAKVDPQTLRTLVSLQVQQLGSTRAGGGRHRDESSSGFFYAFFAVGETDHPY